MISKKDTVSASIKLVLTILLPLLIIIMADGRFNNLEAYIHPKINLYILNKEEAEPVYNKIVSDLSVSRYDSNLKEDNKTGTTKYKTILLNSKIKKAILEEFKPKVHSYELNISGKNFGYINSNQDTNSILKLVANKYIENLSIPKDDVISADVTLKIDLKESKTNISDIKTEEEISNEIYETSIKEDNLLNIDIKVTEIVEEDIPQESITVEDNTMYLGEVKEETGENGKKLVFKEVVYSNGKVSNSTVLKEEIINMPKNTVIHTGSKNPYYDGVSFLNRPTRGGFTTSNYGPRWDSFHKGIDIAGNIGDDVMAAIDGVITYAQYNDGGYGNLIMINHHDEMVTYYAHLSAINVYVGQRVSKGDIIGSVGNTGFSTGPHLHFELRVKDEPVNPSEYLIG